MSSEAAPRSGGYTSNATRHAGGLRIAREAVWRRSERQGVQGVCY